MFQKKNTFKTKTTLWIVISISILLLVSFANIHDTAYLKPIVIQSSQTTTNLRYVLNVGRSWNSVYTYSTANKNATTKADQAETEFTLIHRSSVTFFDALLNFLSYSDSRVWIYEISVKDLGRQIKMYKVSISVYDRQAIKPVSPPTVLFSGSINNNCKLSECVSIGVTKEVKLQIPSSLAVATVGDHHFVLRIR